MNLNEAAKVRCFLRQHAASGTGFGLRFSARFMHPKFALLRQQHLGADKTFPLKVLCARAIARGVQPAYGESDIRVVKTGTLKNRELDWTDCQTVSEDFFETSKFRAGVRRNDILVSSTGVGSLGKVDLYNLDEPALADGHISIVRLRDGSVEPVLLVHLMRHSVVQWQIEQSLTGSTNQIDVYPDQIAALRIPRLDRKKRWKLVSKIQEIEVAIAKATAGLRKPEDVINEVLCAEFNYPLKEHRERGRAQQFVSSLQAMCAGFTLRCSANFHHPSFELTEQFFARTGHERVIAFVSIPIRLGATATKADFVEDGGAYYVHPGATKRQEIISTDDCHQINNEFYGATQRRFGLRPNDVVVNRSGEALGKVALWDSEEPAVASDFTMRIRFNREKMNPRFGWFFFRSVMFQAQIQRELRGSSVPNIFPSEVEQMLMVSCNRTKQDALVDEITDELERRAKSLASVQSKKAEITALINEALGN